MAATETAEAVMRSVTDLGRQVGLSNQEVNVALSLAGFQRGEPGAWGLTEKAAKYAVETAHDNGYGGYAYRGWSTTKWLPSVLDELDLSDAGVAQVKKIIADRKASQKLAREIGTAAADAAFKRSQATKETADVATGIALNISGATRTRILVGLGAAATAYGIGKAAPLVRRRWKQRSDAPQQRRDHTPET